MEGKTVPVVLRSRAIVKTEGTVFPYTDRPGLVNNIYVLYCIVLFAGQS